MTRTESDIETALVAESAIDIDIDGLLGRVEAAARRRRRRRVAGTSAALAVLTAGVTLPVLFLHDTGPTAAPAATPEPSGVGACTARRMYPPATYTWPANAHMNALEPPTPQLSGMAFGVVMDPTGRFIVAGARTDYDDGSHVVTILRWQDERAEPILEPSGVADLHVSAVNREGIAVGFSSTVDNPADRPWILAVDRLEPLPMPAGYWSARATGIGDSGRVVGTAWRASGESSVVVWAAEAGHTVTVLSAPGHAEGLAIAGDGTVVGTVVPDQESAGRQLYVWPSSGGEGRVLATLATGQEFLAAPVRGEWVFGMVQKSGGAGTKAMAWSLRTGLASPVVESGTVIAINARGDRLFQIPGGNTAIRRDGMILTLPATAAGGSSLGSSLSDDGTVVLGVDTGIGGLPVVVWHC